MFILLDSLPTSLKELLSKEKVKASVLGPFTSVFGT